VNRAAPIVLSLLIALGASACRGGHHQSAREVQAERLVQLQVGENVTCRDVHAVNTDVVHDAPVNYICSNTSNQIYAAVVTQDGELTSLSGPAPAPAD
jgi:hypothetical protein